MPSSRRSGKWQNALVLTQPELLKISGHASAPEPTSPVVPFATIIDAWALEHPNPKTKDDYTEKCRKLTDFLGYDDAARVTPSIASAMLSSTSPTRAPRRLAAPRNDMRGPRRHPPLWSIAVHCGGS